ncbi:CinA family protein [Planctomicrobium sp. SH668]|uniref:CinA family protein n=1 Tax=Planctomicrobium sp. SH668 TaxID=3448126 RepID=UPI003F5C76BC
MSSFESQLFELARHVVGGLERRQLRLVLTESCTGGVLSMAMTDVPGISDFYCGSAVTYRNETKAEWLGVSRSDLADPLIGAVSAQVAEQMCLGALAKTPEAGIAASVTGHLGPNSPEGWDGVFFVGIAFRQDDRRRVVKCQVTDSEAPTATLRRTRQREAGVRVLQLLLEELSAPSADM